LPDKGRRKVQQELGRLFFDLLRFTYVGLFLGALAAFVLEKKISLARFATINVNEFYTDGVFSDFGHIFYKKWEQRNK